MIIVIDLGMVMVFVTVVVLVLRVCRAVLLVGIHELKTLKNTVVSSSSSSSSSELSIVWCSGWLACLTVAGHVFDFSLS